MFKWLYNISNFLLNRLFTVQRILANCLLLTTLNMSLTPAFRLMVCSHCFKYCWFFHTAWTFCTHSTSSTCPHNFIWCHTHTLKVPSLKLHEIQRRQQTTSNKNLILTTNSWAMTLSYWSKTAWVLRSGHLQEIVFDTCLYVWVQVFNLLPERRMPQPQHNNSCHSQEEKEEQEHLPPGATQRLNKEIRKTSELYFVFLLWWSLQQKV